MKNILLFALFLTPLLAINAETLKFVEDGLYISDEMVEAAAGVYRISGLLEYSGAPDAAIILGLGAYDANGNPLHGGNFFAPPTDVAAGLLEVASFNFDSSKQTPFDLRVALGGDTLAKIALALDIYMPEGASLKIENLQIVPDGEQGGDSSGSSAGGGSKNAVNLGSSLSSSNALGLDASLDGSLNAQQLLQAGLMSTTGGIIVYLNADTGVDANSGASSALAKRTISSALSVNGVGEIILAQTTAAYVAATIAPASGTTVVFRPQGNITIRGN